MFAVCQTESLLLKNGESERANQWWDGEDKERIVEQKHQSGRMWNRVLGCHPGLQGWPSAANPRESYGRSQQEDGQAVHHPHQLPSGCHHP